MQVSTQVLEAKISAVITRADGSIEDLGVIDSYEKGDAHSGADRNATRKGAKDGDSRN